RARVRGFEIESHNLRFLGETNGPQPTSGTTSGEQSRRDVRDGDWRCKIDRAEHDVATTSSTDARSHDAKDDEHVYDRADFDDDRWPSRVAGSSQRNNAGR